MDGRKGKAEFHGTWIAQRPEMVAEHVDGAFGPGQGGQNYRLRATPVSVCFDQSNYLFSSTIEIVFINIKQIKIILKTTY